MPRTSRELEKLEREVSELLYILGKRSQMQEWDLHELQLIVHERGPTMLRREKLVLWLDQTNTATGLEHL